MKYIPLTQNKQAIVDDEEYEWLNQWKWYYFSKSYAARHNPKNHDEIIFMHKLINSTPSGYITDHINGDKLDNRRDNLRNVNKSQNAINRKRRIDNKSGHPGVRWYHYGGEGKWVAYITAGNYRKTLGYFLNKEDAIIAYETAAEKLHGEYRRTKR